MNIGEDATIQITAEIITVILNNRQCETYFRPEGDSILFYVNLVAKQQSSQKTYEMQDGEIGWGMVPI